MTKNKQITQWYEEVSRRTARLVLSHVIPPRELKEELKEIDDEVIRFINSWCKDAVEEYIKTGKFKYGEEIEFPENIKGRMK